MSCQTSGLTSLSLIFLSSRQTRGYHIDSFPVPSLLDSLQVLALGPWLNLMWSLELGKVRSSSGSIRAISLMGSFTRDH